jgi:hypothetical protein
MMEKIPLIEGWQTQSDGVDGFIEHKFYKRIIPTGLNQKLRPAFFAFPVGEGWDGAKNRNAA